MGRLSLKKGMVEPYTLHRNPSSKTLQQYSVGLHFTPIGRHPSPLPDQDLVSSYGMYQLLEV